MTPEEAADLAARTLAAIDYVDAVLLTDLGGHRAADRERVASDLAGLRDCIGHCLPMDTQTYRATPCPHARRYADGLRRTAALYGIE